MTSHRVARELGAALVAVGLAGATVSCGSASPPGPAGDTSSPAGTSSPASSSTSSPSSRGSSSATSSASGGSSATASSGALSSGGSISGRSSSSSSASSGASMSSASSSSVSSATGGAGPCDAYQTGGTPCVAAFSTVRALYGSYAGKLYQVRRADNTTQDIPALSAGGVANSAMQDAFCAGTTCTISILYDQSGKGNHLTKAPAGGNGPTPDVEAVANALPISISGHKAYGVRITAASTTATQVGYRNNHTTGIATGDQPESLYEVTDGKFFNGACCFDFGNAETNNQAGPGGAMDAIYFGNTKSWDTGAGNGPWVMADMEAGVYSQGGMTFAMNAQDTSLPFAFVTAMLKNNSSTATASDGPFTLKGGNGQTGALTTMYSGARPTGIQFFGTQSYTKMQKQGAIILGIGGDNSSGAQGDFYEGVMTAGYASSATDDAVQANIVAAGYGK